MSGIDERREGWQSGMRILGRGRVAQTFLVTSLVLEEEALAEVVTHLRKQCYIYDEE